MASILLQLTLDITLASGRGKGQKSYEKRRRLAPLIVDVDVNLRRLLNQSDLPIALRVCAWITAWRHLLLPDEVKLP